MVGLKGDVESSPLLGRRLILLSYKAVTLRKDIVLLSKLFLLLSFGLLAGLHNLENFVHLLLYGLSCLLLLPLMLGLASLLALRFIAFDIDEIMQILFSILLDLLVHREYSLDVEFFFDYVDFLDELTIGKEFLDFGWRPFLRKTEVVDDDALGLLVALSFD
jgi:hypothetical protein